MNQKGMNTTDDNKIEALLRRCEQLRQEIQELKILENAKPKKERLTFWYRVLKGPLAFLVVLMLVGIMGTGAWGRLISLWGYYNGNTYKKSTAQIQLAYVAGVSDGLSYAHAINDMKELSAFNNFVHEKPAVEVKALTDRYVRGHPEEMANPMASIIFEAVMTHFKELNP
jgi:hypothetical protein